MRVVTMQSILLLLFAVLSVVFSFRVISLPSPIILSGHKVYIKICDRINSIKPRMHIYTCISMHIYIHVLYYYLLYDNSVVVTNIM